jgi:hypothetical protein
MAPSCQCAFGIVEATQGHYTQNLWAAGINERNRDFSSTIDTGATRSISDTRPERAIARFRVTFALRSRPGRFAATFALAA